MSLSWEERRNLRKLAALAVLVFMLWVRKQGPTPFARGVVQGIFIFIAVYFVFRALRYLTGFAMYREFVGKPPKIVITGIFLMISSSLLWLGFVDRILNEFSSFRHEWLGLGIVLFIAGLLVSWRWAEFACIANDHLACGSLFGGIHVLAKNEISKASIQHRLDGELPTHRIVLESSSAAHRRVVINLKLLRQGQTDNVTKWLNL